MFSVISHLEYASSSRYTETYHAFVHISLVLSHLEHKCTVCPGFKLGVEIIPGFCQVWGLSYLQAKKLACYCFLDTGKRRKIPRSETKDFVTHDCRQPEHPHICLSASSPVSPGRHCMAQQESSHLVGSLCCI